MNSKLCWPGGGKQSRTGPQRRRRQRIPGVKGVRKRLRVAISPAGIVRVPVYTTCKDYVAPHPQSIPLAKPAILCICLWAWDLNIQCFLFQNWLTTCDSELEFWGITGKFLTTCQGTQN